MSAAMNAGGGDSVFAAIAAHIGRIPGALREFAGARRAVRFRRKEGAMSAMTKMSSHSNDFAAAAKASAASSSASSAAAASASNAASSAAAKK
jgi:hypothetical protein